MICGGLESSEVRPRRIFRCKESSEEAASPLRKIAYSFRYYEHMAEEDWWRWLRCQLDVCDNIVSFCYFYILGCIVSLYIPIAYKTLTFAFISTETLFLELIMVETRSQDAIKEAVVKETEELLNSRIGKLQELMEDLVEEILSRVPMTSLGATRSTCKLWNILSKDPSFKHCGKAAKEIMVIMMYDFKACLMSVNLHNHNDLVDPFIKPIGKLKQVEIREVFHCDGLLLCVTYEPNNSRPWFGTRIRVKQGGSNLEKITAHLPVISMIYVFAWTFLRRREEESSSDI
uniref:F-box domain-containing protein n=1 Tax=Boechera stricta TaxID=72658 RepID=K4FQQ4_BOEST|nr:hypothetical protein 7G9.8 [Boechera stricta]